MSITWSVHIGPQSVALVSPLHYDCRGESPQIIYLVDGDPSVEPETEHIKIEDVPFATAISHDTLRHFAFRFGRWGSCDLPNQQNLFYGHNIFNLMASKYSQRSYNLDRVYKRPIKCVSKCLHIWESLYCASFKCRCYNAFL